MTPTLDSFVDALKEHIATPKADLEHNIRAVLAEMVEKMDLVSKQELDRQKIALQQANQRMDALQQQLEGLQSQIKK
ncbi:hypothetical protein SAMN05421749_10296 [Acinetobacter marinus]|uniref:Membrane fusogenic activity n=1 Tax=Acinetobacter marinus TaxID=281375 RepID=A0A1G6HD47_9GAMM|nr:accessory factor UbiK family protein [Acinetobacter marinus]SDB92008.1 hypothetical protein SAMN05421749_10296 [Acinetobacter marinus]